MLGLDPGWLVEWSNMSGAGIACHGRNWSQSTCLLGGQSLVPGSLTAPGGSPKAGVRPKVVRVGFWGHWLRGPRCSRDCVGLLVGRIWGLRAPDAYLLAGGLGPNRAVCGTPDVLRSGSACCCVEPHPGASVCTAQGAQSWFWLVVWRAEGQGILRLVLSNWWIECVEVGLLNSLWTGLGPRPTAGQG